MREVVTKNNPTPQRLRGRGVDVSKTLFYLRNTNNDESITAIPGIM
jgi:hypothetical protein